MNSQAQRLADMPRLDLEAPWWIMLVVLAVAMLVAGALHVRDVNAEQLRMAQEARSALQLAGD